MSNDLISRAAAIDEFDGVKVDEENCTEYDIGYNDGIDFAISKLSVMPSAQPEYLQTVMEKIKEKYEKGMNMPYINKPMAWALYETWKEYDR